MKASNIIKLIKMQLNTGYKLRNSPHALMQPTIFWFFFFFSWSVPLGLLRFPSSLGSKWIYWKCCDPSQISEPRLYSSLGGQFHLLLYRQSGSPEMENVSGSLCLPYAAPFPFFPSDTCKSWIHFRLVSCSPLTFLETLHHPFPLRWTTCVHWFIFICVYAFSFLLASGKCLFPICMC